MNNLIIYNTPDGESAIALYAKDGSVWLNQNQLAELFATSKQNIGQHISTILEDKELSASSVVKNYFTTASDGKEYNVAFYSLEMIMAPARADFRIGMLRSRIKYKEIIRYSTHALQKRASASIKYQRDNELK